MLSTSSFLYLLSSLYIGKRNQTTLGVLEVPQKNLQTLNPEGYSVSGAKNSEKQAK